MRSLPHRRVVLSLTVLAVACFLIAPLTDAGTLKAKPKDPRAEDSGLRNISGAACTVTLTCAGGGQVQCSSANNQCSTSGDGNCVICNGQTQGCCQQTQSQCIDECFDEGAECRAGCETFGACLTFCNFLENRCIDRCLGNL